MSKTTKKMVLDLCKKYGFEPEFASYFSEDDQFYGSQLILENEDIEITDEMEKEFAEIGILIFKSGEEMAKTLAPSMFGEGM